MQAGECGGVSKNDEFVLKTRNFSFKNDELCIKNEKSFIQNVEFCRAIVGRQHWMTNHALAMLIGCEIAESHGLFGVYCWLTIWLRRSPAVAAAHLLSFCASQNARVCLASILEAEAPETLRGFVGSGLLPEGEAGKPFPGLSIAGMFY